VDSFASASDLALYTGIAGPTDLARWQQVLAQASALVRGVAGQVLAEIAADVVVVHPEYDATTGRRNPAPRATGDVIYLPERPVTDVSSVVVQGVPFTAYTWNAEGVLQRTELAVWAHPATITYDHGYPESSEEYADIRTIVMEAAARALTLNERSASEAMGSTLMETAGYAPEVFLTEGERSRILRFALVGVG
jgi:hypothetical protein